MGKILTKEIFITKAKEIHKNKYDYSKLVYKKSTDKVIIICYIHGEFLQEANSHLQGKGCNKCSSDKLGNIKRKKNDDFIIESNKLHKNKYDYSKTKYINNKTKVEIICPIHKSFFIKPNDHLSQKQGCNKCGGTKKLTLNEFIEKCNHKHSFKYDYTLINEYKNNKQFVNIICPNHGIFTQTTKAHYSGNGCPNCKTSKLENELNSKLIKYNISIIRNKTHKILQETSQHFDFFLPEYNIAIECNGRQHYEPVEKFGGVDSFEKTIKLDFIKKQKCTENNITLMVYPYFFIKKQKETFIKNLETIIYGKNSNKKS